MSTVLLDITVIISEEGCIRREQDSNDELRDSELNADLATLISNAG